MSSDDLHIYRRKLPHWRLADSTYFVTWRLVSERPQLTVLERDQVAAVLREFASQRYDLLAYVVMNDHIHVVVHPYPGHALEKLVHTWKSYSAHLLQRGGRRGAVWQREYFDRIIRDEKELDEKVQYILANPSRRWPGVDQYPWVWCRPEMFE